MTQKKRKFQAHLIKYRQTDMQEHVWFWINPGSGTTISPEFKTQTEAEKWFDDVVSIHNETFDLLDRIKNGKFYIVRGKVDLGDVISSKKANECPFTMHLDDDTIIVEVLAVTLADARQRVEEFFEILEWVE